MQIRAQFVRGGDVEEGWQLPNLSGTATVGEALGCESVGANLVDGKGMIGFRHRENLGT